MCDLVLLTALLLHWYHPPTEGQTKLCLVLSFPWLLPLVLSSYSLMHPSRSEFSQFICLSSAIFYFFFFKHQYFFLGFPFFPYSLFLLLGCNSWYLSLGTPYLSLNMCELTNDLSPPYQSVSSVQNRFHSGSISCQPRKNHHCFGEKVWSLLWANNVTKLFLILFTLPLQYHVCKKRKNKIWPPKGRESQLGEAVPH